MDNFSNFSKTRRLTTLGLLTAIVVIFQLLGTFIRFGMFSVSLVLIPIVIGAAFCGPFAGAWLGFVFGLTVLLSGDATAFLQVHSLGTILTVLLKGALAGLCAGLVYRLVARVQQDVAVLVAAVVCPLVNTGVFLLGCRLFFYDTVKDWAVTAGFGENVGGYMILGLVGANFLFELLFNVVLSPVVLRLLSLEKHAE